MAMTVERSESIKQRGWGWCLIFQNTIFGIMEKFFKWYGYQVAKYPHFAILGCLVFAGLCCLGFLNFRKETDQHELWLPSDATWPCIPTSNG
jgi:hypothetical protein